MRVNRTCLRGVKAQCGSRCAPGASCEATNGTFESGSFSGWNQFGNTGDTLVFSGTFDSLTPHGGSYAGAFGPVGSAGGISQVIPANPGDAILVSFWYAANSGGGTVNNSFSATIDGQPLVSYTNDTVHTAWTLFTFGVVSTSTNPTLVFTFSNAPAYDFLDDVSACVTPACNGSCASGSSCGALNGGFETGSFAGWTQFGGVNFTDVESFLVHGGGEAGQFGPSTPGGISQVIPANVGDVVTISFWYQANSDGNDSFSAAFDGQTLVSFTNDAAHPSWTQFTFAVVSTSSNPTLCFTLFNPPSYDYLDDVSACITPKCGNDCGPGSACKVVDGGFETGGFTQWPQFGDTGATGVFSGTFQGLTPHTGTFAADFGPTGGVGGVSQVISANAGDEVTITFWYAALGSDNSFSATLGSLPLVSFTNDTAHTTWSPSTFQVIAPSNNPTLTFSFFNPPTWDFLDDVSVCVTPNCGAVCGNGSSCGSSNGGFETASFAEWTQFGDESFTGVSGEFVHGGSNAGFFGPTSGLGGIRQTVNAHAGDEVTITFWYAAVGNQNSFSAVFDDQTLVTFTNDTAHTGYTQFTFPVVCSSNNPSLVFTFSNPPDFDYLDDVSACVVTPSCGACGAGTTCGSANGGFETSDFSDWSQFGDTSSTFVTTGPFDGLNAHGGMYLGAFGPVSSTGGISQVIPAHPGDHVTISFWYAAFGSSNAFSAVFDGVTLTTFTNDTAHTNWTHFTYNVVSTSDGPTLTFAFYNPPDYDLLDDVSVCIAYPGVCCRGSTCNTSFAGPTACENSLVAGQAAGAHFVYTGTCNSAGDTSVPCCYGDYNKANGITVQDIFDFLNDWFAGGHFARVGSNGGAGALTVQNIFDFLGAWFAGGC